MGAFALRRIRKGTRIVEYLGERVSHREADRRYESKDANDNHTFLFIVDSQDRHRCRRRRQRGALHQSFLRSQLRVGDREAAASSSSHPHHRARRGADLRLPDPARGGRSAEHRRDLRLPLRLRRSAAARCSGRRSRAEAPPQTQDEAQPPARSATRQARDAGERGQGHEARDDRAPARNRRKNLRGAAEGAAPLTPSSCSLVAGPCRQSSVRSASSTATSARARCMRSSDADGGGPVRQSSWCSAPCRSSSGR